MGALGSARRGWAVSSGERVFPDDVFAVWKQMPGVPVTVMSASLLLGEPLPPVKTVWRISGSHVIMIAVMSMGQFALGGICVWLLLEPVFGIDSKAAALIEMSFAGGHGTLAGLTPVLQQHGVGDLLYIGLGLATIGMVTGVVVGTMLVNYAIKSLSIAVARQNPTSPDEDLDIDHHLPRPDDPPLDEWKGMPQVTAAAVCLGVAIAVAIVLLELFRAAFNLAGSGFFDNFPLFPFTFPAAVLVQFWARRYGFAWAVNRRAVEGLGGLAIDGVIVCAIGTLSLAPLGANIGPLIMLAIAAVGWSIFVTLVIGRRIFPRHWFEHSIAEFGESQGMLATGFVMVDMVDPLAADGRREGIQLSADHHAAHHRRRLLDRAFRAIDRRDRLAGLHHRDCGDYRRINRLGHKAGIARALASRSVARTHWCSSSTSSWRA
jgi:glutamate:Na+ symporter, ESS family